MEKLKKIGRKGKKAFEESEAGQKIQDKFEDAMANNVFSSQFDKLKSKYEGFSDFLEDWKRKSPEERAELRDEINTKTLIEQSEELTLDEDGLTKLERGNFLIARVLWDAKKGKTHDHLCFVESVEETSITMVFVTDIFEPSDKPKTKTWQIEDLNKEVEDGKLKFVKFNLNNLEDEEDLIMERALAYKVPAQEVRSLQFAYLCAFGLKEPVYSAEHLSLCDDKTLLMLRTETEEKMVLLIKARKKKFTIVHKTDKTEEVVTYDELASLTGASTAAIYYYPEIKIECLDDIFEKQEHLGHDVAHNTAEVSAIHAAEHGVKHGLEILAPELAGAGAHVFGGALHGIIASIGAGVATSKARKKEKVSKDTEGLKGYSRTRGNKEVSANWSKAAVGTGASIAGSMGTAALIGQLAIPIPGVGLAVGAVVGGVVAGISASYLTKKASNKIYDKNIERKCPLGGCH